MKRSWLNQKDIIQTAIDAGKFNTLAKALTAAGLVETLQGKGPFTVFAPTDDAFAKLPTETLTDLLKPENKQKLTDILTYHVVSGRVTATDVSKITEADTVNGQQIKINTTSGVKINDATVTTADVEASKRRNPHHRQRFATARSFCRQQLKQI
ncbi:MAG: fasciclin domain-containing protein [Pyrinomonadaceae bacterium]